MQIKYENMFIVHICCVAESFLVFQENSEVGVIFSRPIFLNLTYSKNLMFEITNALRKLY